MVVKRADRQSKQAVAEPVRRLFTVDEYECMAEAGVLHEDERVELIEGEIVRMAAIGARHAMCVTDLQEWFMPRLLGRAIVRGQNPLRLARSEPEPDILIVRLRADRYGAAHPGPADVLLLIEVAQSSLGYDRQRKLPLYAAAGIPEVWIADLDGERMLVHREPQRRRYASVVTVERGDLLTPLAFPDLTLTLDDVLGPAPGKETEQLG